ncbi:MAG: glycosyltransferase family 2 protein [Candidatus Omnitrophica bacterium]|nr:glycosyltransferase family 2 protein [Candidatus Omnitrophota bacterium]
MKLSIIIPVYNEEKTIRLLLKRVKNLPREKEIIIVDDGSTDGTKKILEEERRHSQTITKVIFQEKNRGKGAAIRRGIQEVTGEVVVIQDADLEYDPMDLIKLMEPIEKGQAQVVYGSRVLGRNPKDESTAAVSTTICTGRLRWR